MLGRLLSDDVTGHTGAGVDTGITQLGYTYNTKGLPELFTSYDSFGGVIDQRWIKTSDGTPDTVSTANHYQGWDELKVTRTFSSSN